MGFARPWSLYRQRPNRQGGVCQVRSFTSRSPRTTPGRAASSTARFSGGSSMRSRGPSSTTWRRSASSRAPRSPTWSPASTGPAPISSSTTSTPAPRASRSSAARPTIRGPSRTWAGSPPARTRTETSSGSGRSTRQPRPPSSKDTRPQRPRRAMSPRPGRTTLRPVPADRLKDIPGFNIDKVAAAAGDDPDVLRMENLDTDIAPPAVAIEATRAAVGTDDANSWLPFNGRADLKEAVVEYLARRGAPAYDPLREVVITCGEGEAMLDALLCLTDPGDEVILTDPTYAGMLNRVRLAGAVPALVPLHAGTGSWRLDLDALRASVTERTRVVFVNNASFPTGWVASDAEWEAIASLCIERDLWLLYWGGFEGVLYDGLQPRQPAAMPGMRDRTVTVGAPTFEQR